MIVTTTSADAPPCGSPALPEPPPSTDGGAAASRSRDRTAAAPIADQTVSCGPFAALSPFSRLAVLTFTVGGFSTGERGLYHW